jgi:uncharacterized membrane protein YgcG
MPKRIIIFATIILLFTGTALAQTRSVFWQRWDVLIDNVDTSGNRFDVTETYDVYFTGTFSFGLRVIELTNLDDIQNIQIYDGDQPLRQSCSEQAGTFCVSTTTDGREIQYYFTQPVTNDNRIIRIEYTVLGALRIYEGGDQLWWSAIPSDHFGYTIGSSTVTVQMPPGFGPREGVDPVEVYGVPGRVQVNGTTIMAVPDAAISGDGKFEIRVQYPHHPAAVSPRWQTSFDTQREFDENVKPLLDVGILALAGLIALGGPLAIFGLWYTRGRDPRIGPVPTYLSDPPSAIPPALVGSLVDERVDIRDILSTFVDLARRGYMVMEENQTEGPFGIGVNRTFTFKRTDKPSNDLRQFEERVLDRIFSGSSIERTLDSLKNSFYTTIPQIQKDLYKDLLREGFFKNDPNNTRGLWSAGGIGLLVLAGLIFFGVVSNDDLNVSSMLACLPVAIGITGIAAFIFGQAMPAKTRAGAEESAKWKAFYEYLRNLEKYNTVEEAASRFEEFLPYAVAFGLERSWLRKFSGIENVPIPVWYYPTYIGGRYRGGYTPGTPVPRPDYSDISRAGSVGLDQMSGSLTGGLESISTGLTSMLDSAARIVNSQPQSSGSSGKWSSGGSSWSGGGFSGGGSSGGGRSGFG